MKRNPTVALVIVFVAAIVVAAAAYVTVVGPERSKAGRLADLVQQREAALAAARRDARTSRGRQIVQVANILRLAKAMPATTDMPDVLLQINSLAAASGVTFDSITPAAPAAPVAPSTTTSTTAASATPLTIGYQTQPISLIFEGNYSNLAAFMARLRKLVSVKKGVLFASGRLFEVDSMTFAEGQKKFPHLQASLNVETYVYTGSPTTTAGGLAAGGTSSTTSGSSAQAAPAPPATGAAG